MVLAPGIVLWAPEQDDGTFPNGTAFFRQPNSRRKDRTMGRGLLLWLIGIPLPIILVIWLFGGLS
jgi:hypothetical protein